LLGSVAVFDAGTAALNIPQLDGGAKLSAIDGSQLVNIDVLPIGSTVWVNALAAPAGFMKENDALISRASFPRLWAFADASSNIVSEASWLAGFSGAFSTGDLTTTFRIAEARGEFVRGFDDSRGVDASRSPGQFGILAAPIRSAVYFAGLPTFRRIDPGEPDACAVYNDGIAIDYRGLTDKRFARIGCWGWRCKKHGPLRGRVQIRAS
jgi:hypothetical protein